jgi:hypothetical protein
MNLDINTQLGDVRDLEELKNKTQKILDDLISALQVLPNLKVINAEQKIDNQSTPNTIIFQLDSTNTFKIGLFTGEQIIYI